MSSGGTSYYTMTIQERAQAKLATNFKQELYDFMDSFCLQRPCMAPPATFDSGLQTPFPPEMSRPNLPTPPIIDLVEDVVDDVLQQVASSQLTRLPQT